MTFDEFWPFYLGEHRKRANRFLHVTGTTLALGLLIRAFERSEWYLVPVAIVSGYALAWIGHFAIEKNRPATFRHPFLSFAGDIRMWLLTLTGRIEEEIERVLGPGESSPVS